MKVIVKHMEMNEITGAVEGYIMLLLLMFQEVFENCRS